MSVDHPQVVSNYRTAHKISMRMNGGRPTTEDLRLAMVDYRTLLKSCSRDDWRPQLG